MSKYFDKLVKMNESLTKELKDKGLYKEGDEKDTIEISTDALTDEQKKDIIRDKGVDPDVVDGMKKSEEIDAALQTALNTDETQAENESAVDDGEDESNEKVYVRIDDDDLDMHGYLKSIEGLETRELEWTDDEQAAMQFGSEEEAQDAISRICGKLKYDPATFSVQHVNSMVDDNGENWVSIDGSNPGATVIP